MSSLFNKPLDKIFLPCMTAMCAMFSHTPSYVSNLGGGMGDGVVVLSYISYMDMCRCKKKDMVFKQYASLVWERVSFTGNKTETV